MLKIKDTVDLKELEKFGFERISEFWYSLEIAKEAERTDTISVEFYTRIIYFGYFAPVPISTMNENIGVLFDLIQAGLVEKVEK